MALYRHAKGLVVSERRSMDVETARDEFLFQGGDQFLRRAGGREGRTEMGIRIEDDPLRAQLARDVGDVRGCGPRGARRIGLVPLLRADETDQRLLDSIVPLRW